MSYKPKFVDGRKVKKTKFRELEYGDCYLDGDGDVCMKTDDERSVVLTGDAAGVTQDPDGNSEYLPVLPTLTL